MNRKLGFSLGSLVALFALLPTVHAAAFDSISKSMGTAWNAVGAIFSFEYVSRSPVIQEGILKFLIFILILRVVMILLQKTRNETFKDPKTSGIIGFVVAAITVLFTPNVFIFSSIILLAVPVILAISGWMWAMRGFKGKDAAAPTPVHPWLGTLILFVLLILLEFLDGNVYSIANVAVGKMYPFTQQVMSILILVTSILFVWKLFSAIFTIGKGINPESIANMRKTLDTPLVAHAPGRPREVSFALKEPGSVRVTWSDPVEGEKVVQYWIQHRYADDRFFWNEIEKNRPYGQPHELVVGAIKKEPLDVTRAMQFRVCASGRNTAGGYGEWAYSEVRAPKETLTQPLSERENEEQDSLNPPTEEEREEREPTPVLPPTPPPAAPTDPQHPEPPRQPSSNPTSTSVPTLSPEDATLAEQERQKLLDDAQRAMENTKRDVDAGVKSGISADTTFHDEEVDKALQHYYEELPKLTGDISSHNPLDRNSSPNLKRVFGNHITKDDVQKGQAYTAARNHLFSTLEQYLGEAKKPQHERKITFGNVLEAMNRFIVFLLDLVSHTSIWHAQLPIAARDHELAQKMRDANERHLHEIEQLGAVFKALEERIPHQEAITPAPITESTREPSFGVMDTTR